MPYVSPYRRGALSSDSGASPVTSSAAPSLSSGPATPSAPQVPSGSGSFTDLGAYMTANADQAKALAGQITGNVGQQVQDATTPPRQALVGAGRPVNLYTPDEAQATNDKRAAVSSTINGLQTDAGRSDYLAQKAGPGYTAGMANLDSALIGGAGGFGDLKNYLSGLGPVSQPAPGSPQPGYTGPGAYQRGPGTAPASQPPSSWTRPENTAYPNNTLPKPPPGDSWTNPERTANPSNAPAASPITTDYYGNPDRRKAQRAGGF